VTDSKNSQPPETFPPSSDELEKFQREVMEPAMRAADMAFWRMFWESFLVEKDRCEHGTRSLCPECSELR
jgi:hypothetical protein